MSDHIADSLLLAGIGKRYHALKLSNLPEPTANVLVPWFKESAKTEIREGRGWTLTGTHERTYDAAILLSRALHLAGHRTRVLPLRRFVVHLMANTELFEEANEAQVLTLLDFYQTYPGNPVPLTGREVQEVEQFLNDRIDAQRSVILHCAKPLAGETWWSPALVGRINTVNRRLEVA